MDRITEDGVEQLGFSSGSGTSPGVGGSYWREYRKGEVFIRFVYNPDDISVRVGREFSELTSCKGVTKMIDVERLDELINGK